MSFATIVTKWNMTNFAYPRGPGLKLCSASLIQKPPDILALPEQLRSFEKDSSFQILPFCNASSIKNCLTSLQLKCVPPNFLKTPLQPVLSLTCRFGGTPQIELVGTLTLPVNRYLPATIDVFTKYLFAVPLKNVRADALALELRSIQTFIEIVTCGKQIFLTWHFPLFLKDCVRKEKAETQLMDSSFEHSQTAGLVERSHSPLEIILKLKTEDQRNDWIKYVKTATSIQNMHCQLSIDWSPTVLFHEPDLIKPWLLWFKNTLCWTFSLKSDYGFPPQDASKGIFFETKPKLTAMYKRYRTYYDCEVKVKIFICFHTVFSDVCYILNYWRNQNL